VIDVHRKLEGAQGPHAADAEEHLLGETAVRSRVVETLGDPSIARIHRLEEIERGDGVPADPPHATFDLAGSHAHADPDAGVLRQSGVLDHSSTQPSALMRACSLGP
jgi:hypothetical protein